MYYLSGAPRPELPDLHPRLGYMLTPFMGMTLERPDLNLGRAVVGADTGTFQDRHTITPEVYGPWLARLQSACQPGGRILFATAPDKWGDAARTLEMAAPYFRLIRDLGIPAALVAQYGMTSAMIPWGEIDCLFVGGPDTVETAYGPRRWHRSEEAYALVAETKRRGKWAHLGRCNSWQRIRAAALSGYDSADGTIIKYGPDIRGPEAAGWLHFLDAQPGIPGLLVDQTTHTGPTARGADAARR